MSKHENETGAFSLLNAVEQEEQNSLVPVEAAEQLPAGLV